MNAILLSASPLTADAIVSCIGLGRAPTDDEVRRLAMRIWCETDGERSAGMPAHVSPFHDGYLRALKAANLALRGDQSLLSV